jgi:hypothetical protein
MPTPRRKNESEDNFIQRCMKEVMDEYPDISQRYAVCKSYSNKSDKKMAQEEIFVLTPRKTENRGMYLTRCSKHGKIKSQFKDLKERLGFCMTSFNEYYKYWAKMEMAEVPEKTALGECIAREKAKGYTYQEAYAHCATRVGTKPLGPGEAIVLSEDLLVEPVMTFGQDISIDFDDTLSTDRGKRLAEKLINEGNVLHIITRRNKSGSEEVYDVAEELGIPREDVHFTEGKLKWEMIKKLGIQQHIDNNQNEIDKIKENLPDVKAIKFKEIK